MGNQELGDIIYDISSVMGLIVVGTLYRMATKRMTTNEIDGHDIPLSQC